MKLIEVPKTLPKVTPTDDPLSKTSSIVAPNTMPLDNDLEDRIYIIELYL
jgi:hypothetical protein